jgi:spore cortex biosynthesis protein YabQ
MSPDILIELRLLIRSVWTGAALSLGYGLIQLWRRICHHSWLAAGLEDFFYWSAAGFVVFYLLYRENDGALRMYVIVTVLLCRGICNRILRTLFHKVLKMTNRCFKIKPRG